MRKLYNLFFPIWLIIFIPPYLLLTGVVNFVIDGIVLFIGEKKLKIDSEEKTVWFNNNHNFFKRTISVWYRGMLADILGVVVALFLTEVTNVSIHGDDFMYYIVMSIPLLISAFIIYYWDRNYFNKLYDYSTSHKLALIFAIFTAPYTFLIPMML